MGLALKRLAETFCAEVADIDLNHIDQAQAAEINAAWLEHKVLVFHDQHLSEDDLVHFAERLGETEIHVRQTRTTGRKEVLLVSNKKENGQAIGRLGNSELNWHTDQIFMGQPTRGTMLYGVEVTQEGGDTWFCDLAAAFDHCPAALKSRIEGKRAIHSAATADRRVGIQLSEAQRQQAPDVIHPMIRTHPLAGQKALYFSMNHTAAVEGLSDEESQELLDSLREHATQPGLTYRHHWRVGDLVLWDNAWTLHRRDNFPDHQARLLQRVGVRFPEGLRVPY